MLNDIPLPIIALLPLAIGYMLDLMLGDPERWPHVVRLFGNAIAFGEQKLNRGAFQFTKGAVMTVLLIAITYLFFFVADKLLCNYPIVWLAWSSLFCFWGLGNKNLIDEGRGVWRALALGLDAGRKQLSRIVGRNTETLSAKKVKLAVLETLSENLSDGVVAPIFFFALGGVPAMMAYKMVNTLDSMVGYRNPRYELFGKCAARLDDIANFIPARITALLMVLVSLSGRGLRFIFMYGHAHKSPNSGYPEAALAGILNIRFGGTSTKGGEVVEKPFIGKVDREPNDADFTRAAWINHAVAFLAVVVVVGCSFLGVTGFI
ncbi:adenosylcobinamide-phosphate synthase CbiB [Williamwhitmania taraxaci]|uniref:Cobalamin biosynthesis protein CobD n=1 Tax=Williamwhitmania taraxaci TaxID=1640674 RepID=A0A1G6MLG0_9BACT|nr:adenosylcobinamide-phosphate synthase CbiB [Williamwhitmania taraxaci]SDC56311.1 adenosylcobinamide-phosphate synthase [Williamwhitmania taraxaci]